MKNSMIQIILLSIVAILLSAILFISLISPDKLGFYIGSKEELLKEEIYEDINKNIEINTYSTDIKIKESNDDKIHVELYGKNEEDYIITNDKILKIEQSKKRRFCIGFCFLNSSITIYLPEEYNQNLKLNTISGDIVLENSIPKTQIKTTSGDVEVNKAKNISVNTVSGNVDINYAEVININTTSGDIDIKKLDLIENSHITTVSGDVDIDGINDIYIETKTTSGKIDIKNNNRYSNIELNIKTISGDIEIKH